MDIATKLGRSAKAIVDKLKPRLISITSAIAVCLLVTALPIREPRSADLPPDRVEVGNYIFTYGLNGEINPNAPPPPGAARITVTRRTPGSELVVYQELTDLTPGCDRFPAVSKVEVPGTKPEPKAASSLVLLCGNTGGRHNTLKVFRISPFLSSTTLDFYDAIPNFEFDPELNAYVSFLVRRDALPSAVGPIYFPYLYRFHVDESTSGFALTFGPPAERRYIEYYRSIVQAAGSDEKKLAPAIAALAATQNTQLICQEVSRVTFLREDQLEQLFGVVASLGYPTFHINSCAGGR